MQLAYPQTASLSPFTVFFYFAVEGSVLKVESVELVSGATANNVIPPHTWAAVKNTDYVVVKAVLDPDVNETAIPDGFITWTGGESVSGHPLQRRVSKQTAAHTPVIASCGSSSATGDVWIVWANLEIKMSGTTPPNAAQFGGDYDATENLGAQSYTRNGYNWAAGKVIPTGSLTPSGVHNVISNGWDIKREFWRHDFKDGAVWSGRWETSWANDSFTPEDKKRFHPDSDDQIYDFDGPDIGNFTGVTDSCERYDNFRQWVEWNSIQCSDYSGWYWKGRWKIDQSPNVTLKEVGSGAINPLPDENGHYYNPP